MCSGPGLASYFFRSATADPKQNKYQEPCVCLSVCVYLGSQGEELEHAQFRLIEVLAIIVGRP